MTEQELNDLLASEMVKKVKYHLKELTDDQRLKFFVEITEGYCVHCGTELYAGVCYCLNDE